MNYIGTHNLNLIGKVAYVLGASSDTGAAVSRALLNSNAFVLGIDAEKAHDSTRSARGSHFQFFRSGGKGTRTDWKRAMEYSHEMFWKEDVDFLVMVLGNEGNKVVEGVENVLRAMEKRGEGAVLVISEEESGGDSVIAHAREVQKQVKTKGVRCNAILQAGSFATEGAIPLLEQLQDHISEHTLKRKEGGYQIEYAREVAHVALFLCTGLGNGVDGMIVGSDGSCSSL